MEVSSGSDVVPAIDQLVAPVEAGEPLPVPVVVRHEHVEARGVVLLPPGLGTPVADQGSLDPGTGDGQRVGHPQRHGPVDVGDRGVALPDGEVAQRPRAQRLADEERAERLGHVDRTMRHREGTLDVGTVPAGDGDGAARPHLTDRPTAS